MLGMPANAGVLGCDVPENCYAAQVQSGMSGYPGSDGGAGYTSANFSYDASSDHAGTVGWGSSDLATGALKAYATSANYGGGISTVLYERFQFDLPDGIDAVEVKVKWIVSGTTAFTTGSPNGTWASFRIQGWNPFGGGNDDVYFKDLSPDKDPNYTPPTWTNGTHNLSYEDTLYVTEQWLYQLNTYLMLGFNGGGTLDYGGTSYFSLDLPDGVSLVSSSGVLLSDPYVPGGGGAVPEPGIWGMFIAGFGLVGVVVRRKRVLRLT